MDSEEPISREKMWEDEGLRRRTRMLDDGINPLFEPDRTGSSSTVDCGDTEGRDRERIKEEIDDSWTHERSQQLSAE